MLTVIFTVVCGLLFAYLSTLNTSGATIRFTPDSTFSAPLYLIILTSLLVGLVIAWIISILNSLSTFFILRKKENTIHELKKTTGELIKRVYQLELENAQKSNRNKKEEKDEKSL